MGVCFAIVVVCCMVSGNVVAIGCNFIFFIGKFSVSLWCGYNKICIIKGIFYG